MADSKRPTVWIIQSQGDKVDYSQAENWGGVSPLFRGYVELKSAELGSQVKQAVSQIREDDYLLLSGNKLRHRRRHGNPPILN